MTTPSMHALPSLLRMLASGPTPDKVLDALISGPLVDLGVVGASLMLADADELVIVAERPVDVLPSQDAIRVMPRSFHADLVAAGQPGPASLSHWAQSYATLKPDLWQMLVTRTAAGSLIHLPLTYDSAVVGGLGLLTAEPATIDRVISDCLAAALGLWATATATASSELVAAVRQRVRPPLTIGDIEILRLVETGHDNAEISRALHLSSSTVKNRLANAAKTLHVASRDEAAASARRIGVLDA